MLAEKNPQVGKAVAKLMVLSEDERTRMIAESREKMRRDINAQFRFQVRKARMGAMTEVARNLLKAGDSLAKISEATGLPIEEVQKLQQH